jgi:hypothetical protein
MLPLGFVSPQDRALSILAVGAHPDDIEIGAGGTLLRMVQAFPNLQVHYVLLTGSADRQLEARHAVESFLPLDDVTVDLVSLPEGRLPGVWSQVKDALEHVALTCTPDLVIGPSVHDAHQDHRTIAQILPTVFRGALNLGYEIPKWDGDLATPTFYVPLSADLARRKVELLHKCYPSQHGRDWWDDEVFLGLARLRGMESREPYAEGFTCTKSVLLPLPHAASEGVTARLTEALDKTIPQ